MHRTHANGVTVRTIQAGAQIHDRHVLSCDFPSLGSKILPVPIWITTLESGIVVLVGTFVKINKRTGGNFCEIEYTNKPLLMSYNLTSISQKLYFDLN